MNRAGILASVLRVLALAILVGSSGCSEGGTRRAAIVRFPKWPYRKYQTLAVVPFKAPLQAPAGVGAEAADLLERSLHRNPDNTFRLYTRAELKSVLTEQDFSRLTNLVDERAAIPPGRLKAVQAIIVGTLTQYELTSAQTPRHRVVPILEERRGQRVQVGERTVVDIHYLNAARVAARMQILDTATGEIVFTHETGPRDENSQGVNQMPRHTAQELASECLHDVVEELFNVVAVVRTQTRLKSDMLLVAREYYDGRWQRLKGGRVEMKDGRFFGVVRRLPPECTGNPFRVVVVKRDQREPLAQQEFVWTDGLGERGQSLPLDPGDLVRRAGAGTFEVKLYSGDLPVLIRSFEIREPKD